MQTRQTINSKDKAYLLHELVLDTLIEKVQDDECDTRTLETAIKFLSSNNIRVDLSSDVKVVPISSIPRLTDDELKLA